MQLAYSYQNSEGANEDEVTKSLQNASNFY